MSYMLSHLLKCWKTLWDIFISDKEFRKYFANVKGDYRITPKSTKPITDSSGTLVLAGTRSSGEDHFVTYSMTPNRITVFDPSDTSGTYGSYLNMEMRGKISKLAGKPLHVSHRHPQCHSGDTFCQTWSLAWLRPNLSPYINESRTPHSSIPAITRLVKIIANSHEFMTYMLVNEKTFQPIINKKCKGMTVKSFIEMSQHINETQIREILGKHKS